MSIDEIVDKIDAYMDNKKHDLKMQIIMMEVQAQQIVERILPPESKKIMQLWDYYPHLFKEEQQFIERQNHDEELERLKARRRKFADIHNSSIGGDD